jgi:hypothetical protein
MMHRISALLVLSFLAAWPTLAQDSGARPGNEIGTGMSLPRSDKAGNIDARTTQSELAPNLPSPQADEIDALLAEARRDLAANRTGAAQEALERAETRVLDRSVPVGTERVPAQDPLVDAVVQARAALGAGDTAGAAAIIDRALSFVHRG